MIQLTSGSFPQQIPPKMFSNNHKILTQCTVKNDSIKIRDYTSKDRAQISHLHRQWFPIYYDQLFYDNIGVNNIKGIVAQVQLKEYSIRFNTKKVIIGCMVYQVKNATFQSYINQLFKDNKAIYIMTIGIMDQYRRSGIASKFIDNMQIKQRATYSILYTYLHMIETNISAQRFYLKNDFVIKQKYQKFYKINGEFYGSKQLIKYYNGSQNYEIRNRIKILISITLIFFVLTMTGIIMIL